MLQPRQILDGVVRRWGYEYVLVACGACLGLLIVTVVGFDDRPLPPPGPSAYDTPAPPMLPSATRPAPPVTVAKRRETPSPRDETEPGRAEPAPVSRKAVPLPAWQRFAAVHGPTLGRPMIAVIVDDMGVDRKHSARAIHLRGPLTMSFLTYAIGIRGQAAAARRAGHEIMIHVPMQPDDASAYAGPKSIRLDLPVAELRRRIDWALGRLDDYVGINNHMGSRFTADGRGMAMVLGEVKRRGLLFIDSRTSARTVGAAVARRLAVPFAARDYFLDDDPAPDAIAAKLKAVERTALAKGYAIAIGHPRESTLDVLERWLPTLASRGFALVPVSAVVGRRREAG